MRNGPQNLRGHIVVDSGDFRIILNSYENATRDVGVLRLKVGVCRVLRAG